MKIKVYSLGSRFVVVCCRLCNAGFDDHPTANDVTIGELGQVYRMGPVKVIDISKTHKKQIYGKYPANRVNVAYLVLSRE